MKKPHLIATCLLWSAMAANALPASAQAGPGQAQDGPNGPPDAPDPDATSVDASGVDAPAEPGTPADAAVPTEALPPQASAPVAPTAPTQPSFPEAEPQASTPEYEYDPVAPAPPASEPSGPFDQGTFRLSILFGFSIGSSENYLILGAGPGYYLLDGLELELAGEVWLIGDPTIGKLSPGLRYVFHFVPILKPYLGGFYRYTMIEDPYDNVSSLGTRIGAYYVDSQRLFMGLGVVYEHYLNSRYDPVWYPEITLAIIF